MSFIAVPLFKITEILLKSFSVFFSFSSLCCLALFIFLPYAPVISFVIFFFLLLLPVFYRHFLLSPSHYLSISPSPVCPTPSGAFLISVLHQLSPPFSFSDSLSVHLHLSLFLRLTHIYHISDYLTSTTHTHTHSFISLSLPLCFPPTFLSSSLHRLLSYFSVS